MDSLLRDLKFSVRSLFRRPAFAIIAVITLAIGIGANSAIFSVVNAVLLRPLPFKDPASVVAVWETNPGLDRNEVALGNFLDWRSHNQSFEQLGALSYADVTLTGGSEPERIPSAVVTTNLFQVLGVQPVLGRSFVPDEERPGSPRVVILSNGLWQRRFGSDPTVVGRTLSLNGNPSTVIGVMSPGFDLQYPTTLDVAMWLPMRIDPATANRRAHYLYALARLKPGVSLASAQSEMNVLSDQLQRQYPETNSEKGANIIAMHTQLVGKVELYLYVLFAAVGFVLLIACANVANLLLARVATREREVAVRVALGASRWQLVRQLLTESLVLSCIGGALGLLLAYWGVELLIALAPPGVPRLHEIGLNLSVLGWILAISMATGVLLGVVPAIHSSRPDLNEGLKGSGGRNTGGLRHSRTRDLLVISEVALALVLLVGAGLMIRSFAHLQQVSPGFEAGNLLTMNISLPARKYRESQQANMFFEQLLQRVRSVAGVEAAGGVDPLPFSESNGTTGFLIEGGPVLAVADRPEVGERSVTPGYFQAMRIPMLKGRAFTDQDRENSPRVVVINEALAQRFWPNQEVIGKRLGFEDDPDKQVWQEIVGIVGNVRHERLDLEPKPEVFFPYQQAPRNFMSLVVRTKADPTSMVGAIRNQVLSIDGDQPVFDIKTMDQRLVRSVAPSRFIMLLLGGLAGLALILAAVGIYGVMSYAVTQRTQEIGIRMALGAQVADVVKLVVRNGMSLAAIGIVVGLAGSYALTRLLASLLFGVTPTDMLTFSMVTLGLFLVALLACYVPARRATKVDPLVALKYE